MRELAKCVVIAVLIVTPTSMTMAGSKSPTLAKCDGRHRRAANPYGSILPTVDPATGTATPAKGGVEIFPSAPLPAPKAGPRQTPANGKQAPVVPPIGSLTLPNTFGSC